MATSGGVSGTGGTGNTVGTGGANTIQQSPSQNTAETTPPDEGEILHEHEEQWAAQDYNMNQDPKLYASLYSSAAGQGNTVLPDSADSGNTGAGGA